MKERLKKPGRPSLPTYGTLFVICLVLLVIIFQPTFFSHAQSTQEAAPWNGNFVAYQVGDVVSYDHNTYQCLQAHTSEPNWNPHDTAALWQLQSAESTPVSNNATPVSDNTTPPTNNPTPVGSSTTPLNTNPTPVSDNPTPIARSTNNSGKLTNSGNVPAAGGSPSFSKSPIDPGTMSCLQKTHPEATGDQLQPICATFYNDNGAMADGQQTHAGACAVWATQYPLGTTFDLYTTAYPAPGDAPAYHCTAEDVFGDIAQIYPGITTQDKIDFCQNHIDVWNPDVTADTNLGVQAFYLKVTGQYQAIITAARQNNPNSPGCGLPWS